MTEQYQSETHSVIPVAVFTGINSSGNRLCAHDMPSRSPKEAGFTLIEIAAVILVLSSFLLIVLPSFRSVFPRTRLLSSGRRMAGEINRLYHETVFTGRNGRLCFALDRGEYWSDREVPEGGTDDRGVEPGKLLPGVNFRDVAVAGRKVVEGSAHIDFSPCGLVEPSVIHLVNSDGDEISIVINPFTGKVEIRDGYVEEIGYQEL